MGINLECIKSFFKKPATEKYPFEKKDAYDRFRGKITYDKKNCIGCRLCEKGCPADAIRFHKKGRIDFDMGKCIFCGNCRDVCPADAIRFSKDFEYSCDDKKKLIVR